jgi:hypothetical protein
MKQITRLLVGVLMILIVVSAAWFAIRWRIREVSCGDEETLKVQELGSFRFEVTYLSCDTLAKDEAVRVYGELNEKGNQIFARWKLKRTLLLRYDPSGKESSLPSISQPSATTILIAVPKVSSIVYQRNNFANMKVEYRFEQMDSPH